MTYFKKSLVFNPVTLKSGQVAWTRVGRHDGVLATEDPETVAALTKIASEHRLGVTVITEKEYEELKKNPYVPPSLMPSPLPGLRPPPPMNPAPAAASEAPKPAQPAARRARAVKPATSKGALAQS